jgi:WD40 repeat protein
MPASLIVLHITQGCEMSRAACLTGLLLILSTAAPAQDATTADLDYRIGRPQLALNADGHTAEAHALKFTPDGRRLITAGTDRTVRVWDTSTGECLRVIRTPIAGARFGTLFSCDISPDGQLLAVGEFGEAPGDPAAIYLISLETYEIVRRLDGHRGSIFGMQFSYDGQRLVSGSGWDMTAFVWEVSSGRKLQTIRAPEKVWDVIFSPDAKTIATACYDGNVYLWSTANGRRTATLQGHTGLIQSIDWSRDGRLIATGGTDATIRLWSYTGQHVKTYENSVSGSVMAVEFSRDSRLLLAAHRDRLGSDEPIVSVIDVAANTQKLKLVGHSTDVWDATFSSDGRYIASTGGDEAETYIWRVSDGRIMARMAAGSRSLYAAAWGADGKTIAFGFTSERYTEFANSSNPIALEEPLHRTFDLSRLEWGDAPSSYGARHWHRSRIARDGLSLLQTAGATLDVMRGGTRVVTLDPDNQYNLDNDFFWSASLLPNSLAAVASAFGFDIYSTRTGKVVRQLRGHTNGVTAIAASPDDRYLLSASEDQMLCIWDPNRSTPLMSLFFAGEEWIIWTPEGYYAASPGGERLMGWHVNTAKDKVASFYPATQFHKEFYRPDVIREILPTGSLQSALAAAGSSEPVQTVEGNLPPEIEIVSPLSGTRTSAAQVEVIVEARQRGATPITALQLLVDGRPLRSRPEPVTDPQPIVRHTFQVPVAPGATHTLQARVDSAANYGVSEEVTIVVPAIAGESPRTRLYVLAIGVAAYDDSDLVLNFADDDARRVAETFQAQGAGVFEEVSVKVITDKDATNRGILEGLVWLKQEMGQYDVGVIFFSGHGERDETGSLYLLPSNVDKSSALILTAVQDAQIMGILQGIPGRVLLLLDACHAGVLGGDRRKSTSAITDDFVRDLTTDDYGIVVMASSMGREFSIENSEEQSGLFTQAIVEGLQGRADFNGDGHVYFNELDTYVSDRVKELSNGRQHPVTNKPGTIRSFPLSRVSGAENDDAPGVQ